MSIPIVAIYVKYSNINRTLPRTRESEPAPEPSRNPWFGTWFETCPEPVVQNLPRNLAGTRGSEPAQEPSWNPWFGTRFEKLTRNLPGTCRSELAPEPSRNPWFGTCPGTFLEPVVRNVVRNLPRNLSFRTWPGTFPEPVVRNLPRNLPGTCGSEPAPEPSWNPWFGTWFGTCPGTCRSEPAPEPSRNPWFGTCPGTFPEPATWKPPRNRPGPYIGKDPIAKAVGEKSNHPIFSIGIDPSIHSLKWAIFEPFYKNLVTQKKNGPPPPTPKKRLQKSKSETPTPPTPLGTSAFRRELHGTLWTALSSFGKNRPIRPGGRTQTTKRWRFWCNHPPKKRGIWIAIGKIDTKWNTLNVCLSFCLSSDVLEKPYTNSWPLHPNFLPRHLGWWQVLKFISRSKVESQWIYPLVNDHIAGWNDIPIFHRKYIDSIRGPHFPASYVRWSRSVLQLHDKLKCFFQGPSASSHLDCGSLC